MKKFVGALLVFSLAFTLAGCSTNSTEQSTESSENKQETKASKEKEKKLAKEAEKKKKEEQAEKEKQELIAKKVLEADTAMKAAEANTTDETIAAAKEAVEAIPDGNPDLQKRLEAAIANLESIKQQAAEAQRVAEEQAALQAQQQTSPQGPTVITGAPVITEEERQQRQALQEENAQAAADNDVDVSQKPYVPPTHVDDQGREYWFENHDNFKDEPYYTEDWKNNPSPYQ